MGYIIQTKGDLLLVLCGLKFLQVLSYILRLDSLTLIAIIELFSMLYVVAFVGVYRRFDWGIWFSLLLILLDLGFIGLYYLIIGFDYAVFGLLLDVSYFIILLWDYRDWRFSMLEIESDVLDG